MTKREPVGYMWFPRDWMRAIWSPGEIICSGGDDYLMAFTKHDKGTKSKNLTQGFLMPNLKTVELPSIGKDTPENKKA